MSQSHSRPVEITETALGLIEARGVGRLTTAALARRLGFTEAALYRYFSGKGAILAAALQSVAETLFASMPADLAVPSSGGAGSAGSALAAHVRRFTARQGVLLDLMIAGTSSRDGELQEAGNAFLEEYFYRMMAFFERASEVGMIGTEVPARELASLWICQLLGGFIRTRLTRASWHPESHDGYRAFLARLESNAATHA